MGMINIDYLYELLIDAGIPVLGISNLDNTKEGLTIRYAPEATAQQITDGNAILAVFDINAPTPDEQAEAAAKTAYDVWKTRLNTLKSAVDTLLGGFTPTQINNRVATAAADITSWNFNAAAPSVARENAIFCLGIGTAIAVIYLLRKQRL